MSMMEQDYVWIATDSFTSLAHSITASSISSSMEGIVGVKSYISEKEQMFQDFYRRFRRQFGSEYPEEDNHEPGALAVQAYDAVWSVALAIRAPLYAPRGWAVPTDTKPLRIGVPLGSEFKQYVNPEFDELGNVSSFHGFSIELFKAIVSELPFYLPYEFFPYNGSYTDLVKKIYLKEFDAVVGDVAIVARRLQYAEFTHPYTESRLVMIVPLEKPANKALLFMKPFTKAMWMLIGIVTIYNGFIVWLIERNHWHELQGSPVHQTGAFLWLSFSSLFSLQGNMIFLFC
ncbi:hypothetical protein EZV62_008089 [Acer yangbiense]|uniref:Ionotropic glutamate receptor C-terminal domain-containing protein n=1 Tax=Acer yangbiense TaxID=1000413 RepID=A0A5C7ICD1_9ROSI|nr:hypothetical protein EZV62_008089 [Acer yangbiense]